MFLIITDHLSRHHIVAEASQKGVVYSQNLKDDAWTMRLRQSISSLLQSIYY